MLDRIAEFFIFGFAPMVVVMLAAPGASRAAEQVVRGEVVYRERIALPPNALVTVQLADVSLADAPAAIVAERKIEPKGQVPIPFELKFDSSAIQGKNSYALQARITVDDRLMFLNDERHPVDPLSAGPQTVLVRMVNQQPAGNAAIFGQTWSLRFIDGVGAVDSKATFHVEQDGKVTGQAPCNRYFASATVNGSAIAIGKPGATMMACEQNLITQETAFFDVLEKVVSFKIENGGLVLSAGDGRALLRFAASAS
jgi:putative lipoprotein